MYFAAVGFAVGLLAYVPGIGPYVDEYVLRYFIYVAAGAVLVVIFLAWTLVEFPYPGLILAIPLAVVIGLGALFWRDWEDWPERFQWFMSALIFGPFVINWLIAIFFNLANLLGANIEL